MTSNFCQKVFQVFLRKKCLKLSFQICFQNRDCISGSRNMSFSFVPFGVVFPVDSPIQAQMLQSKPRCSNPSLDAPIQAQILQSMPRSLPNSQPHPNIHRLQVMVVFVHHFLSHYHSQYSVLSQKSLDRPCTSHHVFSSRAPS